MYVFGLLLLLCYRFNDKEQSEGVTLEECSDLLFKLQSDYPEEYTLFGLSSIAITSVLPLVRLFIAMQNETAAKLK